MGPLGAMNPARPKTVIVSMACSRQKMTPTHVSQGGMIGDAPNPRTMTAAAIATIELLTTGPQ